MLGEGPERVFIGAYGSEERALGWLQRQREHGPILRRGLLFRYEHTKGHKNRISEGRDALRRLGKPKITEVTYNTWEPWRVEDAAAQAFQESLPGAEEVVIDVSAMTKFLSLVSLCALADFNGTVRIVYSEAEDYVPTQRDYEESKTDMSLQAKFPSRGVQLIARARCLSSVRMQGQPVTLVAFTSFNEQLVRHMLGTISPHRLPLINGRPPRADYGWREHATQEIHQALVDQHLSDNPLDEAGHLKRVASTLDYRETIAGLGDIYSHFGSHERIIVAATGSKMQTVGLFFAKVMHPDIHVEYPTPDSYFVKGMSTGIRRVHEIVIPRFSAFLAAARELPGAVNSFR